MYELRYYFSRIDLEKENLNFETAGTYENIILARGMRKKKAKELRYKLELLKVFKN